MSLQTDLHQAVAQVTADSALLHTIVHGTAAQTVTTEGGAVATVAKLLADADTRINLAADGLLAQSQAAAQDALTSAELAASEADRAQASADQGVALKSPVRITNSLGPHISRIFATTSLALSSRARTPT